MSEFLLRNTAFAFSVFAPIHMNQTISRLAAFSLLLAPLALIARAQTSAPDPTPAPTAKPTKTPRPTKAPKPTKTPRPTPTPTRVPLPVSATDGDNGKTLFVTRGGLIELRMPENRTTPLGWHVVESKNLKLEGEPVYTADPSAAGMTGVGGTTLYRFRAIKNGTGSLALDLTSAGGQAGDKPAETFRAVVQVLK